jgi:hypothetical protein
MTDTFTKIYSYYSKLLFETKWWTLTFFCFLLFLIGIIMFSISIGHYYMIFSNADIEKPDTQPI